MSRPRKDGRWQGLNEEQKRALVASTVRTILDPAVKNSEPQGAGGHEHPVIGLWCLNFIPAEDYDDDHSWSQRECEFIGRMWQYQGRVVGVISDHALVQFYSAVDGAPGEIRPVAFSDLINGTWTFYDSPDEWRTAAERACDRIAIVQRLHEDAAKAIATELCQAAQHVDRVGTECPECLDRAWERVHKEAASTRRATPT